MFLHIKTYNGVLQNTYLNCLSPEFNMNHANLITYNPYFFQMSTNVCSYVYHANSNEINIGCDIDECNIEFNKTNAVLLVFY